MGVCPSNSNDEPAMGVCCTRSKPDFDNPLWLTDDERACIIPLLTSNGKKKKTPPVLVAEPTEENKSCCRSCCESCRHSAFVFLEGKTKPGQVYLFLSTMLVLANYACFVLEEDSLLTMESAKSLLNQIESFSVLIFTVEYLLRLWTCVELTQVPGLSRSCARLLQLRLLWMFTNIFSVMDLLSILPFYFDMYSRADFFQNTAWIRVGRVLRLLPALPYGEIWMKSYKLLLAGGFVGCTVWVICAALYYMFEGDNEDMEGRFDSIPAAMYFSLLNFFGEFPLAQQHSLGGRFVAVFIQVFGVAVLAIPAGALGNAFSDVVSEEEADDDPAEGEGETDAKAGASMDVARATGCMDSLSLALDGTAGVIVLKLPLCCGSLDVGVVLCHAISWLSVASVAHFVLSTMVMQSQNVWHFSEILNLLAYFDTICTAVLSIDYLLRLCCACSQGCLRLVTYVVSIPGLIDVLCWVLPSLSCFLPTRDPRKLWLYAFTIFRILKLERFIGAFATFKVILYKTRKVFLLTGTVALVLWLQCSAIMYYVERKNVRASMSDDNLTPYYATVSMTMWVTLLNLTGENPLSDYTLTGKVITGVMGLFGVGFVSIPMGLLGSAFQDELDNENDDAGESKDDEAYKAFIVDCANTVHDGIVPTCRQKIFKFTQGAALQQVDCFQYLAAKFELLTFLAIFLSALEAIIETMPSMEETMREQSTAFFIFEALVVGLFSVEYVLRLYASPEDPYWRAAGYSSAIACRCAYVTSFSSIIDLLAIAPFYMTLLGSSLSDEYDGQLRMLRVFRLLTLEKYIPAVSLINRVLRNNAKKFKQAFYAALCFWLIFATLLWLTERNDDTRVDALKQRQRYSSVVSALPYTLVHLTGDYPLIDYTLPARILLFFALIGAVGVVAVPTGLLASGFQSELQTMRQEVMKEEHKTTTTLQRFVRGWIMRRRFRRLVKKELDLARSLTHQSSVVEQDKSFKKRIHLVLSGSTRIGRLWCIFMPILAFLNSVAVILESVKPLKESMSQKFLDNFEMGSVLIFTFGYLLQVYAAPMNAKYKFQRRNFLVSFFGIVDLITVLPWWIQMVFQYSQSLGVGDMDPLADAFIFRIFRLLRLLQLENFVSAFTLLDLAWKKCRETLVATGFMALLVWVCGSVLFYNFEKGNTNFEGGPFDTLPMSMYYTGIFLGGEWALIDFTPWGQVVCVFYCVIGIALTGIPVGAVFEAFSTVISEAEEATES